MTGQTVLLTDGDAVDVAMALIEHAYRQKNLHLAYIRPYGSRGPHDNRAWWGLMQQIARESGTSAMAEHMRYAGQFLGWEFVPRADGSMELEHFTTRTLSPEEFAVLKAATIADAAAERGIIIDPYMNAGDPRIGEQR